MRKLYDATGGQPQRWESLGNLGTVKADAAGSAYAVERDWLIISGGLHSVNLTEAGRPVDAPSHGLSAPRAFEAVIAFVIHHRSRRRVDRHMVDLPRRQAGPACCDGNSAAGEAQKRSSLARRAASEKKASTSPNRTAISRVTSHAMA